MVEVCPRCGDIVKKLYPIIHQVDAEGNDIIEDMVCKKCSILDFYDSYYKWQRLKALD